jgi:hypothetical protein
MVDVFLDRKISRDVMVMATGDAPAETDVPEFVKSLQDAVRISNSFVIFLVIKMEFYFIFILFFFQFVTELKLLYDFVGFIYSGPKLMINMQWVHWLWLV